jgi:hypothetical protein
MANGLGETELELEDELESEIEGEGEYEGEYGIEGEGEDFLGGIGNVLGGLLGESEYEGEGEGEDEFEAEYESEYEGPNPVNRVYPDAMMEHMGLAAMEAESEFEAAEHFLPLIPMVASKLVGGLAKAVRGAAGGRNLPRSVGKALAGKKINQVFRTSKTVAAATPRLTKSVSHLTRALHRNPRTRPLVRLVPSIARRAVAAIAKQAASGRRVTPTHAAHILHQQRRHVLGNPKIRRLALLRSRLMDRRFHRAGGFGLLPGVHGRHPGIRTVGLGTGGSASQGLPARFRAPGAASVSAARCPTCGHGRVRMCCCC